MWRTAKFGSSSGAGCGTRLAKSGATAVLLAAAACAASCATPDVHVYSPHCDRTTGYGYQTYQWISDDTAGRIVAGQQKP